MRYACPWCATEPKKLYDMYEHVADEHPDNFNHQLKHELTRSHCVTAEEDDE